MIAVGLMSGTSLDGISAALVDIRAVGARYQVRLLDCAATPYEDELREDLEALFPPAAAQLAQIADLQRRLGVAYAHAASDISRAEHPDYVAMHGQTVFHAGDRSMTLQIGWPYFIRDRLRATVCYDFRSADCAAGGQGAPLVPYADALLLASSVEDRIVVNVGGIANLTYLARDGTPAEAVAFDSGPGNMLLDEFVWRRTDGAQRYDRDGECAARGTVDQMLLSAMLEDGYFAQVPPKSTGRERFGASFLAKHEPQLENLSLEDGAATLTALTAESLAKAIKMVAPLGARVLVGGGGASNNALMLALAERLGGYAVEPTDAMNLPAEAKEAVCFAILGYETLRGVAANLPRVTGAAHATVLGSIVPFELGALLGRLRDEVAGASTA
jgi:anhydro-N-acetylmuramic acid kinase